MTDMTPVTWRDIQRFEDALRDERQSRREAVRQLDEDKADAKDVARLAEEFGSLRRTLQWFMGIVAAAVVAFAGIVVQLVGQ